MASSDDQINTTQPLSDQSEQEPRLAYGRFGSDVPGILAAQSACRLCVSDKLLALGTEDGAVHLLAYDGNKVSDTTNPTSPCLFNNKHSELHPTLNTQQYPLLFLNFRYLDTLLNTQIPKPLTSPVLPSPVLSR